MLKGEKEDIAYFCICTAFAAGIALTAVPEWPGHHLAGSASSASIIASALGLAFIISGRAELPVFCLTYFFIGSFCGSCHSLCIIHPQHTHLNVHLSAIHHQFCSRIDALGFNRDGTAPLLKAMICGDRTELSSEIKGYFRDSGASHLLALSGLHLGTIYLIVSKIAEAIGNGKTSRIIRCALCISFCGLYAIVTGASPSIVRAFLFILISEVRSLCDGRGRQAPRVLMTAFIIQLALSPDNIGTAGFQMSYLATLGICTVMPVIASWYPAEGLKFDPMKKIWNGAALAISCQMFTAPVAWLHFHTFPRYFLLTNLLAIPLTTLLISLTIPALLLNEGGICPSILPVAIERCADLLIAILKTISGM